MNNEFRIKIEWNNKMDKVTEKITSNDEKELVHWNIKLE